MSGDQTLLSAVADISSLNPEATIFAVKPWAPDSIVLVIGEEVNSTEQRDGFDYFLEVGIAAEVIEALTSHSAAERCDRLIQYAINDC